MTITIFLSHNCTKTYSADSERAETNQNNANNTLEMKTKKTPKSITPNHLKQKLFISEVL